MTDPDLNAVQQQLGLTREALAKAMGVHRQTLAKWQREGLPDGQRPPAVALTMARVLMWLHRRGLLGEWVDFMTMIRRKDDHDPK